VTKPTDDAAISARGLTFAHGAAPLLSQLDLVIPAGQFVGLAGPNGAGKSTLLALLCGCLPAAAGTVTIAGRSLAGWTPAELARHLAVLPQKDSTPPALTVREAVLLGRSPHLGGFFRWEGPADHTVVNRVMELTGITRFADRRVGTLSGGERQLVALARALAQEPRILLLDEPAAALDLGVQQSLFRLLGRLHREQGLTVLVVAHDLNLLALYCPRMMVLAGGRIALDGTPAEVLRAEALAPLYGAELWSATSPDGTPLLGLRP
jgi:iron complex transport system ATP-binding protein